jgi:hypothetical protein
VAIWETPNPVQCVTVSRLYLITKTRT